MAGQHAPLPISGAPVWGHCPGSVLARQMVSDYETEHTRRGTATHWCAEQTLRGLQGGPGPQSCDGLLGAACPASGVVVDDAIADAAQAYVDDVLTACSARGAPLRDLLIEHRVHCPRVHPTAVWGTLDCALVQPRGRVVTLWDGKFGHRQREAREDLQMVGYLDGLATELGITGLTDDHWLFEVRMVQPRSYRPGGPVSVWEGRFSDLRGLVNQLHAAAHSAMAAATLNAGPWCRDCPAVGRCPSARRWVYGITEAAGLPYAMDAMTGADLAVEWRILKAAAPVVEARRDAVEAELVHRVGQGQTDSGLTLESTPGKRDWTAAPRIVAGVADQFGFNVRKEKIMTPAQATAAAPAKVKAAFVQVRDTISKQSTGAVKLVTRENTRAAQAFKPQTPEQ